jgi:hypothetical protein
MFSFWYDLPPVFRAALGILLILIAVGIYYLTDGTRLSVGLGATGLVLLLFSRAGSNGSGYNF